MNFLSDTEMVSVREIFRESVSHVLSNYAPETAPGAVAFVYLIGLQRKPYTSITLSGIDELVDIIFTNDRNRDFVLTLSYVFFSRWGNTEEQLMGLAGNLARAASYSDNGKKQLNVIPKELQDRLATTEDAWELLHENRWLMVVLLMQLYVTLSDTKSKS